MAAGAAPDHRPKGRLLDGALLAAGLGLAALVVANALVPSPDDPRAASPLGLIASDPLDVPALRDLGLALDRQGRAPEAEAILDFVGHRTWRDGPTEVWLLSRRLEEGRFGEALASADSLLRRDADGALRPTLFKLLAAAAAYSEARPSLETTLAGAPSWRTDFLQALAARGDPAGARIVLSALAAGSTPPQPSEYAPLVDRLAHEGHYGEAKSAWVEIARPSAGDSAGLRDGEFLETSDQTPFTWSAADGVGATSALIPSADGARTRTLRVDYDGFSSPGLPAQLMVLPPGVYHLTWMQQADPAASAHLFWRVRCADAGQVLATTAATPRAATSAGRWQEMQLAFTAPDTGCAGQWLELAAAPADRLNPTTGKYAAFRLARLR